MYKTDLPGPAGSSEEVPVPVKERRRLKVPSIPKAPKKRGRKKIYDKKPLICQTCGRCASSTTKLILHQRTHTGEKPFSCSHSNCDAKFSRKDKLNIHMRSHTGEKPYECAVCHKTFAVRAKLAVHERIHTGVKPHACHSCDAKFSQRDKLTRHLRIHSGEKPFSCPVCSKGFTRKDKVRDHIKVYHPDDIVEQVQKIVSRVSSNPIHTTASRIKEQLNTDDDDGVVRRNPSRESKIHHKVYSIKGDGASDPPMDLEFDDDEFVPEDETDFEDDDDPDFQLENTRQNTNSTQGYDERMLLMKSTNGILNEWKRCEQLCQMMTTLRSNIFPSSSPFSPSRAQRCHVCKLVFTREITLAQHLVKFH